MFSRLYSNLFFLISEFLFPYKPKFNYFWWEDLDNVFLSIFTPLYSTLTSKYVYNVIHNDHLSFIWYPNRKNVPQSEKQTNFGPAGH